MSKVVAVQRYGEEIQAYKLEDGTVLDKGEVAAYLVNGNTIEGAILAQSKDGEYYLRSTPDGDRSNNLQNLPEF